MHGNCGECWGMGKVRNYAKCREMVRNDREWMGIVKNGEECMEIVENIGE